MTGEITLRGNVLPIGGLKEKILAAKRAGIDTIVCPKLNKKELDEVQATIKRGLKFHLVEHIDEVLKIALIPPFEARPAAGTKVKLSSKTPAVRVKPRVKPVSV
jgi:ATP-dependent Lon protease